MGRANSLGGVFYRCNAVRGLLCVTGPVHSSTVRMRYDGGRRRVVLNIYVSL